MQVLSGVSSEDMKLARMGAEDDNQNSILKGILQNGSSFNYPGNDSLSRPTAGSDFSRELKR